MSKQKKLIESNIKKQIVIFLIYIFVLVVCMLDFPYYIQAPGGLDEVGKNLSIDKEYKMDGSINVTYISEYQGKLPLLIYAYFNKDWKIVSKKEDNIGTLNYSTLRKREYYTIKEAYTTAIIYAYKKANKEINIIKQNMYVTYLFDESVTDLQIGDLILSINDISINTVNDYFNIINKYKANDRIKIKVLRDNKERDCFAKVVEKDSQKLLMVSYNFEYIFDSSPKITIKYDDNKMGPSSGLLTSLYVYNRITENDITKGLKISGTGTIDMDGFVGEIGGVEFKLKGAVKNKADVFFVPMGHNYNDALKIKKKRNYKIDIVGVRTFDDCLKYLENK